MEAEIHTALMKAGMTKIDATAFITEHFNICYVTHERLKHIPVPINDREIRRENSLIVFADMLVPQITVEKDRDIVRTHSRILMLKQFCKERGDLKVN